MTKSKFATDSEATANGSFATDSEATANAKRHYPHDLWLVTYSHRPDSVGCFDAIKLRAQLSVLVDLLSHHGHGNLAVVEQAKAMLGDAK